MSTEKITLEEGKIHKSASDFLDLLPKHKCGLYLTHNMHHDYYQSVKNYLLDLESHEEDDTEEWKNKEAKQRSIDTNEIWELYWYPRTPVNFYKVYAPTLHELLEFAKSVED